MCRSWPLRDRGLESAKGCPELFDFTYANKREKQENQKPCQPSLLGLSIPLHTALVRSFKARGG